MKRSYLTGHKTDKKTRFFYYDDFSLVADTVSLTVGFLESNTALALVGPAAMATHFICQRFSGLMLLKNLIKTLVILIVIIPIDSAQ